MFYNELYFKTPQKYTALFIELVFECGFTAVEERDGGVYVREKRSLSELEFALNAFKSSLEKHYKEQIDFKCKITKKKNENWINAYKKGVKALKIGRFYVHSSWQKPRSDLINVQIDPALAFGSGHHESTNTCIRLIDSLAKPKNRALDVGCGSGILSIVLAKLGCVVDACDTDEIAVASALKNAKINKVKFHKIWLGSVNFVAKNIKENDEDLRDGVNFLVKNSENIRVLKENSRNLQKNSQTQKNLQNKAITSQNKTQDKQKNSQFLQENSRILKGIKPQKYDIVVANLVGDVILTLADDLKQSVENKGFLILSGILEKYEERITKSFADFKKVHKIKTNEWLSFAYQKEEK